MVNTKGQDVVKIQKNHGKEAGTAMTAPQKIHAYEYGIMFLLGCFIYSLLEIAARGWAESWACCYIGCMAQLHGIRCCCRRCRGRLSLPHSKWWLVCWIIWSCSGMSGVIEKCHGMYMGRFVCRFLSFGFWSAFRHWGFVKSYGNDFSDHGNRNGMKTL